MSDDLPGKLSEMDIEAFLNLRNWLEEAIKAAGAEVTDAGMGGGRADIGFRLDGAQFGLSVWPRNMRQCK